MSPETELEIGGKRKKVKLNATIDTGFDGELCIPVHLAVTLGLDLIGTEMVEYADGTEKQELVFKGYVIFLGKKRQVKIFLTNSSEALIGTELLSDCKLSVNFTTGKVRITQ